MRYLYHDRTKKQKMHIATYNRLGKMLNLSLCGIRGSFNRSINAPWTLGYGRCKSCVRIANK